jgi:PAB-dependent poly(A)-specific ribonuclease subunit 3
MQQDDLAALGKLILALACNTLLALQSRESMQASMDVVTRNYSLDLRNLIAYVPRLSPPLFSSSLLLESSNVIVYSLPDLFCSYLLFNQNRTKAIVDIMPMIGARFYTQLDAANLRGDVIEAELAKEVENGRLFRLIAKLCTICDRAELVHSFLVCSNGSFFRQ